MKSRILISALILFASCQEEVVLDLGTLEPTPVIEAIWTDNSTINQVKITKSKDYYQEGENEVIENAEFIIENYGVLFYLACLNAQGKTFLGLLVEFHKI